MPAVLGTASSAETVKRQAASLRADLTRRKMQLSADQERLKSDLERQRREMEAEFSRKRAELDAMMKPLVEQLSKITEIAFTVDLYLGRDETLRQIADGSPATAETPLTIRQRVLVMSEESLILMGDGGKGVDYRSVDSFLGWVTSDRSHIDQIIPEQRGVVVLVPTRVKSNSGNVFEDAAVDSANEESYWLLRNGEKLFVLTVSDGLRVEDKILPDRDEFVRIFEERLFGVRLSDVEPGSARWIELEKRADALRRHYMRILLILQGLIDRTAVWHPLPAGGLSVLRLADQDSGKVVLQQDADTSRQLGDGRPSFSDWIGGLSAQLRPGLRVIGAWNSAMADGDRVTPETVRSKPSQDIIYTIEDRRDGDLIIRFKRTDQVWRKNVPVPGEPGYVYRERLVDAKNRASYRIQVGDKWVLPIDLVTEADLTYYLGSRDNRSKFFLSMVPVLKAAIAAKTAEFDEEASFQQLIAAQIEMEGTDLEESRAITEELISWWKVALAKGRKLQGDAAHQRKAIAEILAEHRARKKGSKSAGFDAAMAVGGVIAVGRKRNGHYLALVPATPAPDPNVFLHITEFTSGGKKVSAKEWTTLPRRSASLMRFEYETEQWAGWNTVANPRNYLTGPQRDELIEQILDEDNRDWRLICVEETFDPSMPDQRVLISYLWDLPSMPKDTPAVVASNATSHFYQEGSYVQPVKAVRRRVSVSARGEESFTAKSDLRCHYGVPWNTDGSIRSGKRTPWVDSYLLSDVNDWNLQCTKAATDEENRRKALSDDAYRYVNAITAIIADRVRAEAYERFVEDYGTESRDLWPAHEKQLKTKPIHPRTIWGVVAIALEHGEDVAGRTLGELAESAHANHQNKAPGEWHPDRGAQNMGEFADVVVPDPR